MKNIIQIFVVAALYCFFSAGAAVAASGNSTGAEATRPTRGVMPEMLFYEAAEQAVEDGYGHIVPESKSEKTAEDTAITDEQALKKAGDSDVQSQQ